MNTQLDGLPGEDLVTKGLADLAQGVSQTQEALLIIMARTKLMNLGVSIPPLAFDVNDSELKLYALLGQVHHDAYREYKALRNRLGRFERALQSRVSRQTCPHTHAP